MGQWKDQHHIVLPMTIDLVANYLRFALGSTLALVDAIICIADFNPLVNFPLEQALALAARVRALPEMRTMQDGRKWRSAPFIIFCPSSMAAGMSLRVQTHAHIFGFTDSMTALDQIQKIVDEYHDRVLQDYENLGILVRIKDGHAQVVPAPRTKNPFGESEHYYAPGDRRSNQKWVTVKRDREGIRKDVELLQTLLDQGVTEREMHRFFEEHPAILMDAMLGIPISHRPIFANPKGETPDFAFSPILGPEWSNRVIELLELKGPTEKNLTRGFHPGFSAKVSHAVDQVRDYERYLGDIANIPAIVDAFGYIPEASKLAVLIGRSPRDSEAIDIWQRRQRKLDVRVVTYDEILQTQAKQLSDPYRLRSGTPSYPMGTVRRAGARSTP